MSRRGEGLPLRRFRRRFRRRRRRRLTCDPRCSGPGPGPGPGPGRRRQPGCSPMNRRRRRRRRRKRQWQRAGDTANRVRRNYSATRSRIFRRYEWSMPACTAAVMMFPRCFAISHVMYSRSNLLADGFRLQAPGFKTEESRRVTEALSRSMGNRWARARSCLQWPEAWLAQRRQAHGDREAEVQVLAERAAGGQLAQIAVRGRDHPRPPPSVREEVVGAACGCRSA